jgi:GT2 family glycosyltransferase
MSQQTYPDLEIIFVDSGSSDRSVEVVRSKFPDVTLIREGNIGYGAGNNRGIELSRGEYIVISNTDLEVELDWLEKLVEAARSDDIGLVAPKILLFDKRDSVNAVGNLVNFVGFGTCRGRYDPTGQYSHTEDLLSPSGASFLVKRYVLDQVGGFDVSLKNQDGMSGRTTQNYYLEAEIAWRARMVRYRTVLEPKSIVYHKYVVKPITPIRFEDLEIGRLCFVLTNYSVSSLLIFAPAFMLADIIVIGFTLTRGLAFFRAKFSSYGWIIRNWGAIMKKRRRIQGIRQVSDTEILQYANNEVEFTHQTGQRGIYRVIQTGVNLAFRLYFQISLLPMRFFTKLRANIAGSLNN